jgi:hypothetical protein
MNIALCRITNDGFVVLAGRGVRLDVDAERAVEFEFQPVETTVSHLAFAAEEKQVKEREVRTKKEKKAETYTVASSLGLFSRSPPSTPSASSSASIPPSLPTSCASRSPSISRSLACFAILNFSVSRRRISAAWLVGLCWLSVCEWLAASVWCVRFSCVSVDCRDCRCCERNWERVERESFMRTSEAVSLAILKCEVHCAMSWWGG